MLPKALVRSLFTIVLALSLARPILAQTADEDWLETTARSVRDLQVQASCFGGMLPQTLHILGSTSSDLVDQPLQVEILSSLSSTLSERTRMRVTKADTFQFFASRSQGFDETKVSEIERLLASSDSADITLLVRPFRRIAETLRAEIILFAQNKTDGVSSVTCTPSFLVSIPVADPQCTLAFDKIGPDAPVSQLEAFTMFFGHCPQAKEVQARIENTRTRDAQLACDEGFDKALRANTVEAFDAFLADFPSDDACRLRASAERFRDQLAASQSKQRSCRDAFDAAKRADNKAEYERFAEDHAQCPQVDMARQFIELYEARERDAADRDRAVVVPSVRPPQRQAQPEPQIQRQTQPQPQYRQPTCYVADVRPPDAWLALRTHPSERQGSRLRKLPAGTPFVMLGERNGVWNKVQIQDGTVGWLSWEVKRWISC